MSWCRLVGSCVRACVRACVCVCVRMCACVCVRAHASCSPTFNQDQLSQRIHGESEKFDEEEAFQALRNNRRRQAPFYSELPMDRVHNHLKSTPMWGEGVGSSKPPLGAPFVSSSRNSLSRLTSRLFVSLGAATAGAIFSLSLSLSLSLFLSLFSEMFFLLGGHKFIKKNENTKNLPWLFPSPDSCNTTRWFAATKCVCGWKSYVQGSLEVTGGPMPHAAIPTAQFRSAWVTFNVVRKSMILWLPTLTVRTDAKERPFRGACLEVLIFRLPFFPFFFLSRVHWRFLKVHCHAIQCFYVDFLLSKLATRRLEATALANKMQALVAIFFLQVRSFAIEVSLKLSMQSRSSLALRVVGGTLRTDQESANEKRMLSNNGGHEHWLSMPWIQNRLAQLHGSILYWAFLLRLSFNPDDLSGPVVHFATQCNVHYDKRHAGHLLPTLRLGNCTATIIFPHNKMAQKSLNSVTVHFKTFRLIVENARQSHTWQWASGHVRSRSEECMWRVLGGWRKKNHSLLFSIAS